MVSPFYGSNDITEIAEDYLERIQELVDKKGYARVTDLAEALDIGRSTVSTMVRKLSQRGFINYERYRGFTLTDSGRKIALQIKSRHETLTRFLRHLDLPEKIVATDVEGIEHHLSNQTLARLKQLSDYWQENPKACAQIFKQG
ncbi:MAG: hypothetical protein B9S32_11770 [Verrucomicrobia bacterium Tous-C9LFEB]|nr:MAG: hypothetical protein B9S32_11770 [Verrucomicrobia bacterium Tous-C9LFEB]